MKLIGWPANLAKSISFSFYVREAGSQRIRLESDRGKAQGIALASTHTHVHTHTNTCVHSSIHTQSHTLQIIKHEITETWEKVTCQLVLLECSGQYKI